MISAVHPYPCRLGIVEALEIDCRSKLITFGVLHTGAEMFTSKRVTA